MIMMEFREEEYDKILEKGKKAKRAICELIESLYRCEEAEYDEDPVGESIYTEEPEISYRGHGGYYKAMRMRHTGYRHHGRYTY